MQLESYLVTTKLPALGASPERPLAELRAAAITQPAVGKVGKKGKSSVTILWRTWRAWAGDFRITLCWPFQGLVTTLSAISFPKSNKKKSPIFAQLQSRLGLAVVSQSQCVQLLCTWLLQHSADNLSNGIPEVRSVWQQECSNLTDVKGLRFCFLSFLPCYFHLLSHSQSQHTSPFLGLCLPSLCWENFLTGQRNKAFPGEADQALELAQGTEQNCVTRAAREDDGKKYNNIPSQWLWEIVRSVQGLLLSTPSNTFPLQRIGLTCLTELSPFEGSRAGDALVLSRWWKGRRGPIIHVSRHEFNMQYKERYPNSSQELEIRAELMG